MYFILAWDEKTGTREVIAMSYSANLFSLTIADLTFSALQVTAVSAFSEAPNFAVVDLFGGQSQKFLTGRKLATWGASLELSTTLGTANPDAVVQSLLAIEAKGDPVTIAYNGTYDGIYRIGVSATDRQRVGNRVWVRVALDFEGTTDTGSVTTVQTLTPTQATSPWSKIAKLGSSLQKIINK
jgi:hypothetical protein